MQEKRKKNIGQDVKKISTINLYYILDAEKTIAERKVILFDNIPFYESTGANSKNKNTWFPFLGEGNAINLKNNTKQLWFIKPDHGESISIKEVQAILNDSNVKDYKDLGSRLYSLKCMLISCMLGGGFWDTKEGKALSKKMSENSSLNPIFNISNNLKFNLIPYPHEISTNDFLNHLTTITVDTKNRFGNCDLIVVPSKPGWFWSEKNKVEVSNNNYFQTYENRLNDTTSLCEFLTAEDLGLIEEKEIDSETNDDENKNKFS